MSRNNDSSLKQLSKIYTDDNIYEEIIDMFARGHSISQVVDALKKMNVVVSEEEIEKFYANNIIKISDKIDKISAEVPQKIFRSKAAFRIIELNKIIEILMNAIEMEKDSGRSSNLQRLVSSYLQAVKELKEELNSVISSSIGNMWSDVMKKANPEQKKKLMEKILEIENLINEIMNDSENTVRETVSFLHSTDISEDVMDADFDVSQEGDV